MKEIPQWAIPMDPVPEAQIVKTYSADVVILGAGHAGTAAARAAADADGDFVPVLDHIEILHATAQESCHSLHKYASRKQKSHVRFRA